MRLALRHAFEPAQVAFARYYLGELALSTGRPREAIRHYSAGLTADPTYVANLEGRAKALRALGHTNAALRTFAAVVLRVPQPSYVLEYGDLLDRLGRTADAEKQYAVFRAEEQLFRANGVTLDTDETLFEANHGDPQDAVAAGRAALRTRPFLESYDAYAWALHQVGRDHAALAAVNLALRTGGRTPLFHLHRRAIERALGRPGGTR
jgi:tetratricopeptide (TPR) repeat protein